MPLEDVGDRAAGDAVVQSDASAASRRDPTRLMSQPSTRSTSPGLPR
jgi:hypothetical protein